MTGRGSQAGAARRGQPGRRALSGGLALTDMALQGNIRSGALQGCTMLPYCPAGYSGSMCWHARAMLILTCHYLRAVPGLALLHHCPQALGVKLIIRTDIIDKRWYATVIKA